MDPEERLEKKTVKRLSRIKGQVEGIEKMVEEDRDCFDIMQQIAAVRSALATVGVELLKGETVSCVSEPEKFENLLNSLFRLK